MHVQHIGVGITYLAAKNGATAEETAIIGTVFVYESAVQSALWGMAVGGAAGAAAGAIVGM